MLRRSWGDRGIGVATTRLRIGCVSASTNTLVINPVLLMYPHTRYEVVVTSRVVDGSGNHIRSSTWSFTTGS